MFAVAVGAPAVIQKIQDPSHFGSTISASPVPRHVLRSHLHDATFEQ